MQEHLVVTSYSNPSGLVAALAIKHAFNVCGQSCGILIVESPVDFNLADWIFAGRQQTSPRAEPYDVHVLAWPETYDGVEVRILIELFTHGDKLRTVVATERSEGVWRREAEGRCAVQSTLARAFPMHAARCSATRMLFESVEAVRRGDFGTPLARAAVEAASEGSADAAQRFLRSGLGAGSLRLGALLLPHRDIPRFAPKRA